MFERFACGADFCHGTVYEARMQLNQMSCSLMLLVPISTSVAYFETLRTDEASGLALNRAR